MMELIRSVSLESNVASAQILKTQTNFPLKYLAVT